jgi:hypothetical protein
MLALMIHRLLPAPGDVIAMHARANFDNMPELHWRYGYFLWFWGLCLAITITFIFLLHRWGMFDR